MSTLRTPKILRSFITGSWAYGDPRDDSDVDLVVLISPDDLETLAQESEEDGGSATPFTSASLRFGNLNLICETEEEVFLRWRIATKILRSLGRPVTRDEAIALIDRIEEDDLRNPCSWDMIRLISEWRLKAMAVNYSSLSERNGTSDGKEATHSKAQDCQV